MVLIIKSVHTWILGQIISFASNQFRIEAQQYRWLWRRCITKRVQSSIWFCHSHPTSKSFAVPRWRQRQIRQPQRYQQVDLSFGLARIYQQQQQLCCASLQLPLCS